MKLTRRGEVAVGFAYGAAASVAMQCASVTAPLSVTYPGGVGSLTRIAVPWLSVAVGALWRAVTL